MSDRSRSSRRGAAGARLRIRLWADCAGAPAITEAGADLLEQIHAWGSLSEAARRLHFSYRRAWLLVNAMNRAWDAPLVSSVTGGKRGGGAQLTDRGRAVLGAFRQTQAELQHFLDDAQGTFNRAARG